MRVFRAREADAAMGYAEAGGQALHVTRAEPGLYPGSPRCFERSTTWGHLIDRHAERLKRTARRLGVRRIVVSRPDRRGQHVDLCGRPLQRAMAEARTA